MTDIDDQVPDPDQTLDKLICWARSWQFSDRAELLAAASALIDLDQAMRSGRVPESWMPRWCLSCKRENVSEWTICEECLDSGWWSYCVDYRHVSGPYPTRDVAVEEAESFECLGRHEFAGPGQLVGCCPACRRRDVPLNSMVQRGVVKWLCGECL